MTRATQRQEYNFLSLNSSTPIKNTATTGNQNQHTERSIHFNPNPIQHLYSMTETTSHNGQYKPPANDSTIQGAGNTPGGQFPTNTTSITDHNKVWRNINRTTTTSHTNLSPSMTTAEATAIATEHAENLQPAPQAQLIATFPLDTTQQPHHHH